MSNIVQTIQKTHSLIERSPFPHLLFRLFFRFFVPYSNSIRPKVLVLKAGYAKVEMNDRKSIHNHLGSIHAVALMNLAELTSGLAFNYGLPPNTRAILTQFQMDFLKKARGDIIGECRCDIPQTNTEQEYSILVELKDSSQSLVAKGVARWLVRPEKVS